MVLKAFHYENTGAGAILSCILYYREWLGNRILSCLHFILAF